MPKRKQTRRSISVSGVLYERCEQLSKIENRPLSKIVEELLKARCDAAEIPTPLAEDVERRRQQQQQQRGKKSGAPLHNGGGVFSF